jgi:hypothetical protein
MNEQRAISQFNKIKSCIGNMEAEDDLQNIRFVLGEMYNFFKNYFTSLNVFDEVTARTNFLENEKIINTSGSKDELMRVYKNFYSLAERQIKIINEANE